MKTFDELDYQTVILSRKEIKATELDNEGDLKDLISVKLKTEKFVEIMSGWDAKDKHYVVIVKS